MAMKLVSIQELKRHLSALVAEAAAGDRILVTRHRQPVVLLGPAESPHVHTGKRFGKASGALKALVKKSTGGRILEILADDRRGDKDAR
jgi:prevent-host-death family protein